MAPLTRPQAGVGGHRAASWRVVFGGVEAEVAPAARAAAGDPLGLRAGKCPGVRWPGEVNAPSNRFGYTLAELLEWELERLSEEARAQRVEPVGGQRRRRSG